MRCGFCQGWMRGNSRSKDFNHEGTKKLRVEKFLPLCLSDFVA
jgi:hypothetical protein